MNNNEGIKQLTKLVTALSNGSVEEAELLCNQLALEPDNSGELEELGQAVAALAQKHLQAKEFILDLSAGNFETEAPRGNRLLDPFKELQANLRHLVWQTRQIARGDYNQRIDFPGDFSGSFNSLVVALNQKKKVEEALRESEYFFKESQRVAFIGSYKTDFVAGYWESSEVLDQIFGIGSDYYRNVPGWLQIVHPDDREMMNSYLVEEVIAKRQPFNKEYRIIRHNDGQTRWVHGLGQMEFDPDGKILSMIGTIQDITDRKQVEEAVKKSEQQFRNIFDNSIEGIFQSTLDGRLQIVNPAFAQMFGYESTDEMISQITNVAGQLYVRPEDRALFLELLRKQELLQDFEVQFKRKDGSTFWVSINSRIVQNNGGPPLYLEGTFIDITKRKLAEEQIRMSEARLKRAELASRSGNWELHLDSQIIYASEGARIVYGLDLSQVDYSMIKPIALPEYRPMLNEAMKNLLEKNIPYDVEFKIRAADTGVVKDIQSKAIFDSEQRIVFGVIQDITERKRIENSLQESQARLKTLLQTIPDLIWLKDKDGVYLSCNNMFEHLFGKSEPEIVGKTDYDFVEPELADFFRKHDRKAIQAGGPSKNEEWVTFADDGHRALLDTIKTPMFDSNGALIGVLGIARDITERKRIELALQESQFQLTNAIKTARLGSWEYNAEADLFTFNDNFYNILRTSAAELGGYNMSSSDFISRFIYPEDMPVISREIRKAIEAGNPEYTGQIEHRIFYADGDLGYITVRFFIEKNEKGKTAKAYGITQDITERIKTEEILRKSAAELREINAAKDKFFSIIAHDLKNPLNSIVGFSDLLAEQVLEKNYEGIEEYAAIIQDSSKRVMDLLMNLLEWSRSQTGRLQYNPEFVDLTLLISQITELSADTAFQKSISLNRKLPRNAPVIADTAMISTVLRNLISNAIKFTHPGGHVTISVEQNQMEVVVSVADNGVGIKKSMIEKLFKIEDSYSTTGTQNEKGTGLGLILCHEFVGKHGGHIWVNSEVGKGSTFHFSIPRV